MAIDDTGLYRMEKKDITTSGKMLYQAFKNDPVWKEVMAGVKQEAGESFFSGPARYGMRYGKTYAPSEEIEGTAVWVPGRYSEMTFWRGLLCGSAGSSLKLGGRTLKRMQTIFAPLERGKEELMTDDEYIYLLVLGIAPEHQGKGLGKRLLNQVIQESEESGLPIFLETSTENNVQMYEHFGFKVIGEITHPIINLPHWEMIRELT